MIHIMSKEEKELWDKSKELTSKKYKSKEELENRVFILETQLKNDIKMLEIKQNKINKQKEVLNKIKEVVKKDRVYIAGERNLSHEIEELLEEIE